MNEEAPLKQSWLYNIILVISIFALFRVSVPNLTMLVHSYANHIAFDTYSKFKDMHIENELLEKPSLSAPWGVKIHYHISTQTAWHDRVTILGVSHQLGTELYRLVWINDKLLEQVVLK